MAKALGSLSKGFVLKTKVVFPKTKGLVLKAKVVFPKTKGLVLKTKVVFRKTKGLVLKTKGLFPKTKRRSLESKPLQLESKRLFVEPKGLLRDRTALSRRTTEQSEVNRSGRVQPCTSPRRTTEQSEVNLVPLISLIDQGAMSSDVTQGCSAHRHRARPIARRHRGWKGLTPACVSGTPRSPRRTGSRRGARRQPVPLPVPPAK
jgi:hypothetical protein